MILARAQERRAVKRVLSLTWQRAYANDQPFSHYEIIRGDASLGRVVHYPQSPPKPCAFPYHLQDHLAHRYRVETIDAAGRRAGSAELFLPGTV